MNDFTILQSIDSTLKSSPDASQRVIAKNANLSVGKMNVILKRFIERGWIMVKNVNGRKLSYALSPSGMNELYERGKSFAVRTFAAVNEYNDILYKVFEKAKENGKIKVVLYGSSYIRFLIVYTCEGLGMQFEERSVEDPLEDNALCLIGEQVPAEELKVLKSNGGVCLVDLVQGV